MSEIIQPVDTQIPVNESVTTLQAKQISPAPQNPNSTTESSMSFIDKAAPYIFIACLVIALVSSFFIYQTFGPKNIENSSEEVPNTFYETANTVPNQKLPINTLPTTAIIPTEQIGIQVTMSPQDTTPTTIQQESTVGPSANPTTDTGSGTYACDPQGICNNYGDPNGYGQCPKTFADPQCLQQCDDLSIRCVN